MRLNAFMYYADFFIAAAAIIGLAAAEIMTASLTRVGLCAGYAVLGFGFWTLFEYIVHRFVYHHVPFFKDQHDAHHAEPDAFIGAPPVIGILMIFAIAYAPLVPFSDHAAAGFTMGMLTGYVAYMLLHHAAHHWNVPEDHWLYRARRHHALHHHLRLEGNYGITTSLWDEVFGTSLKPGRMDRLRNREGRVI